jgi:hypothetical protein
MSSRPFDTDRLSTAELEERLRRPDLPDAEREALVEALSDRVAEELVAGRDTAAPTDPPTGTHSFEPPPVTRSQPRPRPAPVGAPPPFPPPRSQDRIPAPAARRVPEPAGFGEPEDVPRKGFRRFFASFVALALVAGGAWVAITIANRSGYGGDHGGDGSSEVTSPTVETVGTGEGSGGRQVPGSAGGPVGTARVDWILEGVPYVAMLRTNGSSGTAEVAYVDPRTGQRTTVREALRFGRTDDGVFYYGGSNPRNAATAEPIADYSPDIFVLVRNTGGWSFTRVCDTSDRCAEASTSVP